MVSAIKQVVTVKPGGHIDIDDPQLPVGTQAEVIVLVQPQSTPQSRLAALDALQKSMNLSVEAAEKWMCQVREERKAWGDQIK